MGIGGIDWRCPARVVAILDMIINAGLLLWYIFLLIVAAGVIAAASVSPKLTGDLLTLALIVGIIKILMIAGRLAVNGLLFCATDLQAIMINRSGCFTKTVIWLVVVGLDFCLTIYDSTRPGQGYSITWLIIDVVCLLIVVAYALQLNSNEVFPRAGMVYQPQYTLDEYGNQIPMEEGMDGQQPQDGYYGYENEQQKGATTEPSTVDEDDEDEDDAPKAKKKKNKSKKKKKKKGGD